MNQATSDEVAYWALLILSGLHIEWGNFWIGGFLLVLSLFAMFRIFTR